LVVNLNYDTASQAWVASLRNRIGGILDQLRDLPVGIATRKNGSLDISMLFGIMGCCPVGSKSLAAQPRRIVYEIAVGCGRII